MYWMIIAHTKWQQYHKWLEGGIETLLWGNYTTCEAT